MNAVAGVTGGTRSDAAASASASAASAFVSSDAPLPTLARGMLMCRFLGRLPWRTIPGGAAPPAGETSVETSELPPDARCNDG